MLAVATFGSVRSANRSARAARVAEKSLLTGQRPLLVHSRPQDPEQVVTFVEWQAITIPGGGVALHADGEKVYLAISVRNAGTGLAVLHGWHIRPGLQAERSHPPLEDFTAQILDLYVAPGDIGYWQAAPRDADPGFAEVADAIRTGQTLKLSLLYGDFEDGQRMISQFGLRHERGQWHAVVGRHFNLDRPDPR